MNIGDWTTKMQKIMYFGNLRYNELSQIFLNCKNAFPQISCIILLFKPKNVCVKTSRNKERLLNIIHGD